MRFRAPARGRSSIRKLSSVAPRVPPWWIWECPLFPFSSLDLAERSSTFCRKLHFRSRSAAARPVSLRRFLCERDAGRSVGSVAHRVDPSLDLAPVPHSARRKVALRDCGRPISVLQNRVDAASSAGSGRVAARTFWASCYLPVSAGSSSSCRSRGVRWHHPSTLHLIVLIDSRRPRRRQRVPIGVTDRALGPFSPRRLLRVRAPSNDVGAARVDVGLARAHRSSRSRWCRSLCRLALSTPARDRFAGPSSAPRRLRLSQLTGLLLARP